MRFLGLDRLRPFFERGDSRDPSFSTRRWRSQSMAVETRSRKRRSWLMMRQAPRKLATTLPALRWRRCRGGWSARPAAAYRRSARRRGRARRGAFRRRKDRGRALRIEAERCKRGFGGVVARAALPRRATDGVAHSRATSRSLRSSVSCGTKASCRAGGDRRSRRRPARSRPAIMRIRVDLPAPLAPTRRARSPLCRTKSTPSNSGAAPKRQTQAL